MVTADVLFSVEKQVAFITLNRPKALNALNFSMIQALYQQLLEWQQDDDIHAVVIQAAEGKAFCAGGDIKWLYETGKNDVALALSFFEQEYRLNQLIHNYPKPYVAIMDGMTMGGGVGVSLHGSHPIATSQFVFAMPETAIGFFPDIGASYLLARCPDDTGIYLGLTGQRLNAEEAFELGLVKQVVQTSDVPLLLQALVAADLSQNSAQKVTACLEAFTRPSIPSPIHPYRSMINQCFQYTSMSQIVHALQQVDDDWSNKTQNELKKRSPLSLCVTLEQLQRAKALPLDACLAMDMTLVKHFMRGHDFYEGVRALLIDKDQAPKWQPAELNSMMDHMTNGYFI